MKNSMLSVCHFGISRLNYVIAKGLAQVLQILRVRSRTFRQQKASLSDELFNFISKQKAQIAHALFEMKQSTYRLDLLNSKAPFVANNN